MPHPSLGSLPPMWVIYDHPLDEPEHYVVRRWDSPEDVGPVMLADTLEQARQLVPDGAFCLGRQPGDDPKIVEVWV